MLRTSAVTSFLLTCCYACVRLEPCLEISLPFVQFAGGNVMEIDDTGDWTSNALFGCTRGMLLQSDSTSRTSNFSSLFFGKSPLYTFQLYALLKWYCFLTEKCCFSFADYSLGLSISSTPELYMWSMIWSQRSVSNLSMWSRGACPRHMNGNLV
jgi:hypothetical protein